jgi:hypothetical protein
MALVAGACLLGTYEAYAYYQHVKRMHSALQACSSRISIVLSHNEYDPANLDKALRNINEAMAFVDGVTAGVRERSAGPFRIGDGRELHYLDLCAETLRLGKAFTEAALEFSRLPEKPALAGADREKRFGELMRQRAALRGKLTDLYNESYDMREAATPLVELVDIGSIEHAQQEIYFYYSSAN